MSNIDQFIAERVATSSGISLKKLRLRFDRVALRVLKNLRETVQQEINPNDTILMTLTAPIIVPAKTEVKLISEIRKLQGASTARDIVLKIHGNTVRLRVITDEKERPLRFIGFVHHPETNTKDVLDAAAEWLVNNPSPIKFTE